MEFIVDKRYLNFAVTTGAPARRLGLIIDGAMVREFEIGLAPSDSEVRDEPDFWCFLDVSAFRGRPARLEVTAGPELPDLASVVSHDDEIRGAADLYREKLRPQFHFSTRRGWNNDPNGLVYHTGEYHLYYQHNPYGWNWGNMHWGHAVSADLVHWTELPVAIYPRRFGDWVFSGSAVVDENNTGGFRSDDEDVIVAAYTSTGRGECIAYSNDCGRTFTEYAGNPVLRHRGRDPKLIWYAPGEHWVMAVYDEEGEGDVVQRRIAFHTSTDLKHWEFASRLDGYYECPEIFELPVDGDWSNTRWVVYAADGSYAIGGFDGRTFTPESGKHPNNHGNCFHASQTFSNIPPADGRRIQIAWGRAATPGMPFNQCMLFPCELTLHTTAAGIRMFTRPVRELSLLHGAGRELQDLLLRAGDNPLAGIAGECFDLSAEFTPDDCEMLGIDVRGIAVTYDPRRQELSCLGHAAALPPVAGRIRLQILVDRTTVEIFGNAGLVYMPLAVTPEADNRSMGVFCARGSVSLDRLSVHELRSAWK